MTSSRVGAGLMCGSKQNKPFDLTKLRYKVALDHGEMMRFNNIETTVFPCDNNTTGWLHQLLFHRTSTSDQTYIRCTTLQFSTTAAFNYTLIGRSGFIFTSWQNNVLLMLRRLEPPKVRVEPTTLRVTAIIMFPSAK